MTHDSYLLSLQRFCETSHTDPNPAVHDVRFRGKVAPENWIFCYIPRIWYETSLVVHLGDIHSDHPSDILAFSLIVYLVVRSNINKVPVPGLLRIIARDATYYFMVIFTLHLVLVLFLVFGSVRISLYCMLHHLSTVRSDVYSLTSSYFLQGESHQDAFRSFVHPIFLRAIVGPLCTSGDLFAF